MLQETFNFLPAGTMDSSCYFLVLISIHLVCGCGGGDGVSGGGFGGLSTSTCGEIPGHGGTCKDRKGIIHQEGDWWKDGEFGECNRCKWTCIAKKKNGPKIWQTRQLKLSLFMVDCENS